MGWTLFLANFVGAAAALAMTQWAHAKGGAPTVTIAAYDAAYVLTPVFLLPLASGYDAATSPTAVMPSICASPR